MAPNPMQVFSRLGFAAKIIEAGWPVELLRLQDSKSGDLQIMNMSEISKEFGFETIALHLGVLQRLLYEQLQQNSVRFGCEVQSVNQSGNQVFANLPHGSSVATAIVVGADGFNSQIRRMAELGGEKRYSGSSSYRAIARGARILTPEAGHEAYEIWSEGCRVGFSKINADDYYWYMTFDAPAGEISLADKMRTHAETLFQHSLSTVDRSVGQNSPGRNLENGHQRFETTSEVVFRTHWTDRRCSARNHTEPWTRGRHGCRGRFSFGGFVCPGRPQRISVENFRTTAAQKSRLDSIDFLEHRKSLPHGKSTLSLVRNLALKKTPESVSQKQVQRMYSLEAASE